MNKKISIICSIFCLLITIAPVFAQVNRGVGVRVKKANGQTAEVKLYDESYALVIGNSNYSAGWDNLSGVASDVVAVSQSLERQGFKVEVSENLTRQKFDERLRQFIDDHGYEANNRLLIYYAGHGHTLKSSGDGRELGYVVPVDAPNPAKDENGFRRRAISMDTIQTYAKEIQSKHALFIFDSCFSGKLVSRSAITIPPVILENVAYAVRQFITAGAANQPVPDESIFRRSFVRGLEGEADRNSDGYITGTELADYLKDKVTNYSNRAQTPQYGKINDVELDKGDFVFVLPNYTAKANSNSSANQSNTAVVNGATGESSFWSSIENSTDARDFESYLSRSDSGEFSGTYKATAELKLLRLKRTVAAATWARLSGVARNLLKYDYAGSFSEGLALVRIGDFETGKSGYIDKTGREVIPLKYDVAYQFSEGLALVRIGDSKTGKWGFIDKTGREVIPLKYDYAGSFSEGLAAVRISDTGKWGFIDKTGREVIPLKYDYAYQFSEGLAQFRIGNFETGKSGYIDKTGREVIPLKYDYAYQFSEGLAQVLIGDSKTGKYGFIDKTGREVIPLKYDYAGSFSEGLAPVRIGDFNTGKWGFIDKTGREIIPIKYDGALSFSEGLAKVRIGDSKTGKWGFIDKTGREIIPIKYDKIWSQAFKEEGIYGVELNGRKGFVDIYGNEYFDF